MKTKCTLFVVMLLLVSGTNLFAQKVKPRVKRLLAAHEQIQTLRSNVLFVEILDESHLTTIGSESIQAKTAQRLANHSEFIQQAFEAHYTFSDIRFFKSSEYKLPSAQNQLSKTYIDPDSEIGQFIETGQPFLIASFTTSRSYEEINYVRPNEVVEHNEQEGSVYREYEKPISGLYVLKGDWSKIEKPFPFYTRVRTIFLSQEEIEEAVKKLNKKLIQFYNKMN